MPPLESVPPVHVNVPDTQAQQMDVSCPDTDKKEETQSFKESGRTELRGGRICFAGATSFLSNFFLVCFVFGNIKYQSLEQCYHHTHAILAKALKIAALINKETDGVKLKNLAKRILFCAEWVKVCGPKMDEMIEAKFTQNPGLIDRLMRTAPYELVETSVDMKSSKYDTGTFPGENKFGLKLTGYRDNRIAMLNKLTSD